MNLTLLIKLFIFVTITTSVVSAQTIGSGNQTTIDHTKELSQPKKIAINLGFYKPFTTNTSYIGRGTQGEFGFDVGVQVFVYKNIFIGTSAGYFFLDVTDTNLVGDYERSRAFSLALELGYEQPITRHIDIGAGIAPLATTSYRNYISEGRVRQQRDNASAMVYRAYVSYKFTKYLAFFVNYAFRSDASKIETAPEIQNKFNKIQYHNVGFGFRIFIF
ncbi:hypothetical protein [uncultured Winogradskyella sp.]|uniref:hypothetical protein n=1 Tax=uncultured Winogradskyella sp. TaxID=395353 RepID=UPI0030D7E83C|tara:strand:- start:166488 stop:167141 length:654 start_codon:yes stop_codon:yes gene_type:complete